MDRRKFLQSTSGLAPVVILGSALEHTTSREGCAKAVKIPPFMRSLILTKDEGIYCGAVVEYLTVPWMPVTFPVGVWCPECLDKKKEATRK